MPMIKRPMKGVAVDDLSQVRLPVLASPKIDAFRCVLHEHPLTSRLQRFPNRHLHKTLKGVLPRGLMLDGEIVVGDRKGPGVLQRTSSGLTSEEGKPDFTLWVFDQPGIDKDFWRRHSSASLLVKELGHPRIKLLKHVWIERLDDLEAFLALKLEQGYEGIIIRDPKGPYKEGKSTLREQYMLKVKPFVDAEGIVTGYYEEMENTNEAKREVTGKLKRSSAKAGKVAKGRLGGLILRDIVTGIEVRVGGGFQGPERDNLWPLREDLIGKRVRYKKQKVGEKDKPRHPNFVEFVDFRPEWDE